jgi:diguanylate cyclase (GGDEF)-like protein/PAS domain S-box-containing protein
MKDEHKTKEQLIDELIEMRQRAAELEASENERKQTEQAIPKKRVWLSVAGAVVLLCILVWLNEVLDLPHLLLGAPQTPTNWREALIETALIASVGLFAVLRLARDITERQRAEEEVRRRNQELAALNAIATTMMQSALGLDEVLQQIADGVVEGLGCNTAVILLLDEKEGVFKGSAVSARGKIIKKINALIGYPLVRVQFPARSDFNEAVSNALEGRITTKHNLHELVSPALSRPVCSALQRLMGSQTFFSLPLLVKGKTVGGVFASTREKEISEGYKETMVTFTNQAAVAIENARLFEAERERSTQLSAVARVAERIASILNPDELLRETVELITQTFGYFYAAIMLLDAETNELVFNVGAGAYAGQTPAGFRQKVKEGMIGRAAHLGQTIWANDVSQEPHYIPAYLSETRSELDVPLKYHDRVIGVLDLQSQELNAFTQHDVMAMETLAGHVAAAIENARLYQEVRQRALEQETLREAALALTTTLDRNRVIERVLAQLQQVVPYDSASVQLLQEDMLILIGGRGFPNLKELLGTSFPADGDNPNREVVRTLSPFILEDAPTIYEAFTQEPHAAMGIRSWLGVPMLIGERLVGMITLDKCQPGFYTQQHARLAEAFAAQAAIAIENARLYEETGRRAGELAALYEIALAISATLEIDELLKRIYEQVSQLVSFDAFWVALVDEEMEELQFEITTEGGKPLPKRTRKLEARGSLAGWVAHTRKPFLISDWDREKDALPTVTHQVGKPVQSWLGIPLLFRDRVVGVMSVQSFEPYAFDEKEQHLLIVFANQVAIAIENARLFGETERLKTFNEDVVQGVAEAILIESAQGILTFANPAAEKLLGYTREELIGRHWTTIVPEEQRENVGRELAKRPQGELSRYETALLSKGGQVIPVIVSARPMLEDGEFAGVLSAFTDIRERVRKEREIEERQVYLEGVLRDAPDAIVTLDDRFQVVEWNAGAERLFGYSREEAVGQHLDHLVTNPAVFEEAIGFTQRVLGGKALPPTESVRYRKDGSPVDVIIAGSPILVEDELIGAIAVYTDITARVRMEETLRALALIDELTGLYNRRGFFTLAQQQLKTANRTRNRLALLFADFDGLKRVNDTFGHPEGDRALIEVADILRKTFRESDIIARIGGDEFVVLGIETNGSPAEVLTARLQENLAAHNAREGRRYELALSVGLARYDPKYSYSSIDDLLAQADRAMYERKRSDQKAQQPAFGKDSA